MNPMSDERQSHLIKAAEATIELMNLGIEPNAALTKVAEDAELNTNEVALVSHAVNNSKTVSHLTGSAPDKKGEPFTLTNAAVVNENLWSSDPRTKSDAKDHKKDMEKKEDQTVGQPSRPLQTDSANNKPKPVNTDTKKEAAYLSRIDSGSYLEGEPEDFCGEFAKLMVKDNVVHGTTKVACRVNPETLRGEWLVEEPKLAEGQTLVFHQSCDPFQKLSEFKLQVAEARLMASDARQQAEQLMDKLAEAFRRTDAPQFHRVEESAIYDGVDSETIGLVYDVTELEKFGHIRATHVKTAGVVSFSHREAELAGWLGQVDQQVKLASDALAAQEILEQAYRDLAGQIQQVAAQAEGKTAAAKGGADKGGGKDTDNFVNTMGELKGHLGSLGQLGGVPHQLLGGGHGYDRPADILNAAADRGNADSSGPEFQLEDKTPLDLPFRQGLANADARGHIEKLMSDEFIGHHPIQDVVGAYNRAIETNPDLGGNEMTQLIRQDLASGGSVPLDTLLRVSGSK
jgi:hypothetical protein